MGANTEVVEGRSVDIKTEEEFFERADELTYRIADVTDQEPHGGVTVFALINALADSLVDLANTNKLSLEDCLNEAKEDLDDIVDQLQSKVKAKSKLN